MNVHKIINHVSRKQIIAVLTSISLLCVLLGCIRKLDIYSSIFKRQAIALPQPAAQTLYAKTGESNLKTTFRLANLGNADLMIKSYTTSCGCTEVKIDNFSIVPKQFATISVEATPFSAGERSVLINLETNDPSSPNVVFRLTMIGATPPPFLESNVAPLNFGDMRPESLKRTLWINTCELKSSQNWLEPPITDRKDLTVNLISVDKMNMSEHTEKRSYRYEVAFNSVPTSGAITGNVIFSSSGNSPHELFKVPVTGTIRDPVYAVPKAYYRRISKLENQPGSYPIMKLIVTSNDRIAGLEVFPDFFPSNLNVHKASQSNNVITFIIELNKPLDSDIDSHITFRTNVENFPTFNVPILLVIDNK